MSTPRPGTCGDPGPGKSHCTEDPGHRWSCYDAGDDVAWNDGMEWLADHNCAEPDCSASSTPQTRGADHKETK